MTGILFDLDRTLIHSLPDITAILNRVRADYGLSPKLDQELLPFIGNGIENLMALGIPELPARQPALIHAYRTYYLENPHAAGFPYPGVKETLARAQGLRGIRWGIVTNKQSSVAEKTLAYYLPEIHFDIVAGPEKVKAKKPDPRHLLDVIAYLNLKPSDCWFLGDHEVDAACASAAGVRFLGAAYGFGGVRAAVSLSSFAELTQKIPVLTSLDKV
jgi:2-phosphoglycolate phosphatase